jgi:ABC-type polysaccharide/polyol phosphate transport system ATPase subunit
MKKKTPTAINFKNISKSYHLQQERTAKDAVMALLKSNDTFTAKKVIEDISFSIKRGETVGLVGKNGAGKSTILKLLAGVTYPDSGKITVAGRVAPLIELTAGFHHELNGYENIFLNGAILGMQQQEIETKVAQITAFAELEEHMYQPVKRYSTGMYMRLGFSIAVHTDADILLIDEVLGVGDAAFQKKSTDFLKKVKSKRDITIVFVSHDQHAVESFCDRALLIENGKLSADGKPKEIFQKYNASLKD